MKTTKSLANNATYALALTAVLLVPGVTPAQVGNAIPYKLNPGSTYQTGCFPPCTCPLSREFDLTGTFTLTCTQDFIGAQGLLRNFAMRDVEWTVSLPDSPEPPVTVTGFGTFVRDDRTVVSQWMRLKLKIGDAPSRRFVGLVLRCYSIDG